MKLLGSGWSYHNELTIYSLCFHEAYSLVRETGNKICILKSMINVTAKTEKRKCEKCKLSHKGVNLHKGSHVAGTLGGRSHRPFKPLQLIITQDDGCLFLFLFLPFLFVNLYIIWLIRD